MTDQTTSPLNLAHIEARANAATEGPWCTDAWEIYQGTEYQPGISMWIGETCRGTSTPEQDQADAAFVAAARTDVPALLDYVRRLQAELADFSGRVNELESQLCQCQPTREHDDFRRPAFYRHEAHCPVTAASAAGESGSTR